MLCEREIETKTKTSIFNMNNVDETYPFLQTMVGTETTTSSSTTSKYNVSPYMICTNCKKYDMFHPCSRAYSTTNAYNEASYRHPCLFHTSMTDDNNSESKSTCSSKFASPLIVGLMKDNVEFDVLCLSSRVDGNGDGDEDGVEDGVEDGNGEVDVGDGDKEYQYCKCKNIPPLIHNINTRDLPFYGDILKN